jgi:hypothetical protein
LIKNDEEIINLIGQKEKGSDSSKEFGDCLEVADEVPSDIEV